MKQSLLLILFLYFFSFTYAQEYIFGVKAGINNNTIGVIHSTGTGYEVGDFEGKNDVGYQIGGYFMAEFKGFFIRSELNYVSIRNHYDFPNRQSKWTTSKIEVPILFGLEVFKPVSIYAGTSFYFSDEVQLEGVQETSFSDGGPDLDRNTISLNLGLMVRYNRFSIDLRYVIGTKNTEEERLDINHGAFGVNLADLRSYKPKMLRLSLSIDLFRTDGTSLSDLFKGNNNCGCPY